ncbi:transglutaminase family protein [Desulfopila sp. IMCC35008]|uniref:transglutaminase-like domain-containing protein n=1 Tax=Desulfopila sp. IMCC35008 TaxID=2653858 RepID=UPI0013D80094|nr:transglutaminase family protein [Desulfopila sp. IMCC35008]
MDESHYLVPTATLDFDHPEVMSFIEEHTSDGSHARDNSVALYYAVRDLFRYDPYRIELTVPGIRASATLEKGYGWCVSKAVLLAACCRGAGIPARLGFGDVRNHLSTSRMREWMQTDIFYWHGFTEILLEGRWLKATPAFNLALCKRFRISPLEFNGVADSIFHPFDEDGNRHMEYVNGRGHFADLPLEQIRKTFASKYKKLIGHESSNFENDVNQENSFKVSST